LGLSGFGNGLAMLYACPMSTKDKSKPTSVRHTRAIQRDRTKRPTTAPSAEVVEERLTELIHPATYAQIAAYQDLGLRHRILTLPVMVAFVLSLIWRQIGSVSEAVRVLGEEGFLWVEPLSVSQQAMSLRLRSFPPELFRRVLFDLLPLMHERVAAYQRPLPPALAHAKRHFSEILALDGSTLDVLLQKVGLLRELDKAPLAGRIAGLLDVGSQLPKALWYEEDSTAHDQRFWERALLALGKGTLVLFDLGFTNYGVFDRLSEQEVGFITRAKQNTAFQVETAIREDAQVHDRVIRLGKAETACQHPLRLVEMLHQGKWYRFLTNILDPEVLPAEYVVSLYYQRWRIEDALSIVKRLLGLSYFWTGSNNGVQVQLWATWLLYAVLVDLTHQVSERLNQPFRALSLEMVYRALYHFTQAYHRGKAQDPIDYLADKAKTLALIKRKRASASPLPYLTALQNA
jgi:DDE family transposase